MKKNGFTLIELLAVIVILAVILVIAVPKITDTINSTKQSSLESSVKMVAAAAETQYNVAQTLGNTFTSTGDCLAATWGGLNSVDYDSCEYTIDTNGAATVEIHGKAGGKFASWETGGCTGNRSKIDTCTKD